MKIPSTYPHLLCRCVPQRYLMSFECFLILMVCYVLRYSISFAIPKITKVHKKEISGHDCPFGSLKEEKQQELVDYEFHWTAAEQGVIHGGFFYGYMTTQLVGGILSDIFNHKVIMMTGLVLTIIFVVIQPTAARLYGYVGLAVIRVCIGLVQGLVYNSMFAVTANWVPAKERTLLSTLIFTGIHFGSVVNGWLTGLLLKHFDWSVCFYVYGLLGALITIMFFFTTYTYPSQYPRFSPKEQAIFDEHRQHIEHHKDKRKKVPFKQLFSNIHVWAIFLAVVGEDWALFTYLVYIPTYLHQVLHFPIDKTGFYSGFSFLLLLFYAVAAAPVADYLITNNKLSATWTRKFLYLIASIGCGLGYFLLAFGGCNVIVSTIGLLGCYPLLGMFYPSVKTNAMDLSPNYAGTIGSFGNFGGTIAGSIVSPLVSTLVEHNTLSQWRIVFTIAGSVVTVSGILYFLMGSGEVQPFDSHAMESGDKP